MDTPSNTLQRLWPALLVLLLGCPAGRAERATLPQLQLRSSFDLACPYTQLSLVHFDRRSKGVSGCGRQISYVEDCQQIDGRLSCTWLMDSLPRAQGPAPPNLSPIPAPTVPAAPPRLPSSDLKPPDWDTQAPPPGILDSRH